jgi:hypothetical protein
MVTSSGGNTTMYIKKQNNGGMTYLIVDLKKHCRCLYNSQSGSSLTL